MVTTLSLVGLVMLAAVVVAAISIVREEARRSDNSYERMRKRFEETEDDWWDIEENWKK